MRTIERARLRSLLAHMRSFNSTHRARVVDGGGECAAAATATLTNVRRAREQPRRQRQQRLQYVCMASVLQLLYTSALFLFASFPTLLRPFRPLDCHVALRRASSQLILQVNIIL